MPSVTVAVPQKVLIKKVALRLMQPGRLGPVQCSQQFAKPLTKGSLSSTTKAACSLLPSAPPACLSASCGAEQLLGHALNPALLKPRRNAYTPPLSWQYRAWICQFPTPASIVSCVKHKWVLQSYAATATELLHAHEWQLCKTLSQCSQAIMARVYIAPCFAYCMSAAGLCRLETFNMQTELCCAADGMQLSILCCVQTVCTSSTRIA